MLETTTTPQAPAAPALADLTPYLSAVLMIVHGRTGARTACEKALAIASGETKTISSKMAVQKAVGNAWTGALVYVERKPPSWWRMGPEEVHHELLVAFAKGGHLAICASDAGFREKIADKIASKGLASPVPRKAMASAFVGPDAKTAWLNGVHTPSAVKPDAKMLSGQALEYAIDPLGDHTYYLSALRSRPEVAGLGKDPAPGAKRKNGARPTIGAAPGKARIWLGRPASWNDFTTQLGVLLDHLAAGGSQVPVGLGQLAEEIDDVSNLGDAYSLALLPASLTDEDATRSEVEVEQALRIAYEAKFDIIPLADGGFEAEVELDGDAVGTMRVTLDRKGDIFTPTPTWTDPAESLDRAQIEAIVRSRDGLKIYYDDGRTFADGRIFSTQFLDKEFDWTFGDFTSFDVHREKPGKPAKAGQKGDKLVDAILAQNDNSLFDYVRKHWGASGMLTCDDGSMEIGDFLHFDPARNRIELIHAKAAGGKVNSSTTNGKPGRTAKRPKTSADRQISVSDYEIVAAQAIKNIRHLDKAKLIERLEKSSDNQIAKATWEDGKLVGNRARLIDALKKASENLTRVVTILQPRLTRREIETLRKAAKTEKRAIQFNQLNALMLGTRQAVASSGAEFTAIADGQGSSGASS